MFAFGPQYTAEILPLEKGQQVIFEATEPLQDGTAFQVLVDFPHGLVTAIPQPWQIVEDNATLQYRIPSIDVQMVIGDDGRLHISEQQQVVVEEGNMVEGFRTYTWLYLDLLDEIFVREGEQYYTYIANPNELQCENCFTMTSNERPSYWVTTSYYDGEVEIDSDYAGGGEIIWRFPTLVKGEGTTFGLEFIAEGVIGVSEASQQLNWAVLPGYDVPVEQASLTVQLPAGLDPATVEVLGALPEITADGNLLLTMAEPATEWAITLTLPPKATNAPKPLLARRIRRGIGQGG